MSAEISKPKHGKKRLIVCCDGTWMNSDYGFVKSGPFGDKGTLQVPSNVTRISRCFKRRCADGTLQIISYQSGVGTGSNLLDNITGGAFGIGLAERVRETYAHLCANYSDGDEIFLVGFSRGAFTARSVAGMIGQLGLLTREGVEHFYPIFKDMQNWQNDDYDDPFPTVPFRDKPKGPDADDEYRQRLEKLGFTRVTQASGDLVKVKAVCVWDTVGSLGVPKIAWLEKLGIRPNNDEFKWHDTALSDRIEHAFQALALDETRAPFSPAVWERRKTDTTDLRQVWFPGNHGNCGGGWDDQGIANCTLAWMMDQMASVGVEFDMASLKRVIDRNNAFYESLPPQVKRTRTGRRVRHWAVEQIHRGNTPLRPWALGAIRNTGGLLYAISGRTVRTPGMYRQVDRQTTRRKDEFLQQTSERVHSSVRVRLACQGLGLDDKVVWKCEALADWRLKRAVFAQDRDDEPIQPGGNSSSSGGGQPYDRYQVQPSREGWMWAYEGGEPNTCKQKIMVEERLGPHEQYLLELTGGKPNVYEFADRSASHGKRREVSKHASHTY